MASISILRLNTSRANCGRWIVLCAFAAVFCLYFPSGNAQDVEPAPAPLLPIPLSEIPTQAAAVNSLIAQVEALQSRAPVFDSIEVDLSERERTIGKRLVSLRAALAAAASREAISELGQEWLDLDRQLEDWEKELRDRAGVIERQLTIVNARSEVWRLTVVQAAEAEAPDDLISLARSNLDMLQQAKESLEGLRERALALQGKVGRSRASVQEALDRVSAEETDLLANLIRRERPPLWSEAVTDVPAVELVARAKRELDEWWLEVYSTIRGELDRVIFQILVLLGLALLVRRARKSARAWTATDPGISRGMSVFEKPVALAALIVLLLTPWIFVSTPPAIDDAVGLLLVLPVLRLVSPLLEKPVRPALYLLAALYLIDRFRDLVEAAPVVARIIFIFEMIVAIAITLWLIRSQSLHGDTESKNKGRDRIRFGLDAALVLLVIAALGAVAGFMRLAVLIGYGVLNSAYLALLLAALLQTADAIIALTVHSQFAQRSRIISARKDLLRRRTRTFLTLAALVTWILITLDLFALRDYLMTFVGAVLFAEFRAGAIALSLADVFAFVITIAAAIWIARLFTLILEEDVYSRIELGRGVPFAISSVVKYGIIALGFLLAVGAMGMGMDRITILLGALGVGLGFGLQNVVNNFVSGLILIFERPVQVGDSVEVSSIAGRITRIGIRSSTIRSFDGADITIPNGSLLSDALTNWTMTDRTRRIDVNVGVAYGTNPDEVIEVLTGALKGQEGLLEQPEPQVLFTGFGDSSLDFVLRAWVADNDQFVKIRSKIALEVNRGLEERGIEIPFPQRDLHVRSVAAGVLPVTA